MKKRRLFIGLLVVQALLLLAVSFFPAGVPTADAAPAATGLQNQCVRHKRVQNFNNEAQLQAKGFFFDIFGSGSLDFDREGRQKFASLHLGEDYSGEYMASRITEIDDSLPISERIKCWQPTAGEDVVAAFTVRFAQENTPFGLTENLFLWNAPFGEEGAIPLTSFGVSRNQVFPGYIATVSQNVVFTQTGFSGFLDVAPMPGWLDPTDWHDVRVTVSQYGVKIEAAQGINDYTTVLETALPEPVEPLGFEFSVDNEAFPGFFVPVTVPDTLDVSYFDIRLR